MSFTRDTYAGIHPEILDAIAPPGEMTELDTTHEDAVEFAEATR